MFIRRTIINMWQVITSKHGNERVISNKFNHHKAGKNFKINSTELLLAWTDQGANKRMDALSGMPVL